VKKSVDGYTQINGRQVRRYKTEWTQDDAEREMYCVGTEYSARRKTRW
jgi:hypothetical protein